jgi:hypothetical protein
MSVPTQVNQLKIEQIEIQHSQTQSIYNFGMICSWIVGLAYVAIAILLVLDPAEANVDNLTAFYQTLREKPLIPFAWRLVFVGVGFLTIPCITAISKLVRTKSTEWEGFYQWTLVLGYVGTIMSAIEWMREYFAIKAMIYFFHQADKMYKIATEVAAMPIDPDFLWKFGGLGLWYFAVSLLAYRKAVVSKWLGVFGMFVGGTLILAMVGGIFDSMVNLGSVKISLQQFAGFIAGMFFAPVFHIGMAFTLQKNAKTQI